MNRFGCMVFAASAFFALSLVLSAYEPRISLSGRKDRVISTDERGVVLDVATTYLDKAEDAEFGAIDRIGDPFSFGNRAPVEQPDEETDITVAVDPNLTYDDAVLLDLVAARFSEQVRGILTRSGGYYLQLAGGRLLTIGDSFPFRLPNLKEESFTVTVDDITARGYTLRLNESQRYIPLEDFGNDSSAGAIRDLFE